jgi:hypothetical protein
MAFDVPFPFVGMTYKYTLTMEPIAWNQDGPELKMDRDHTIGYEVRGWLTEEEGHSWIYNTNLRDWHTRRLKNSEWSFQNGYKTAEDALAALQHEFVI